VTTRYIMHNISVFMLSAILAHSEVMWFENFN